ncbi:uncharacterized protein PAC_10949 [Phialocephala subalpina]|uniref:Uncharacterized protein n=1 Tax=Phialocephala subalpina TaxID=576137 RepID=A0A1L7X7R3_9HELO|nr:uncharacterized protein PAC_10949 [Phialocephala subalpina]
MSQCAIIGKQSIFIARALLGILGGSFIPDIVLWLSYFYTGHYYELDRHSHVFAYFYDLPPQRCWWIGSVEMAVSPEGAYHPVSRDSRILHDASQRSPNEEVVSAKRMVHHSGGWHRRQSSFER